MSYCDCEDIGSNPIKSRRVTERLLWRFAKSWLFSSWVQIPPRPRYSLIGKTLVFKISIVGSSPTTCVYGFLWLSLKVKYLFVGQADMGSNPIAIGNRSSSLVRTL